MSNLREYSYSAIYIIKYTPRVIQKYLQIFVVLYCGWALTMIWLIWYGLPNASEVILKDMDKYIIWISYLQFYGHIKAKQNIIVSIFYGIYCTLLLLTYQNTLRPRQNGFHLHRIFPNSCSCINFLFKLSCNLFPRTQFMIGQDWFQWWLVAKQTTNHCLKSMRTLSTDAYMCGFASQS